jgi:tetratricopeptide (TPR) repeat protein
VGQLERARVEVERAMAAWRDGDGQRRRLIDVLVATLNLEFAQHDLDAAFAVATQVEALLDEVAPDDRIERGLASNNVGTIAHQRHDFATAAQAWDRALALLEPELGFDDPTVIEVRTNSAGNLLALGKLDAARSRFEATHAHGSEIGLAWTSATLGLAEIELRSDAPERARVWLDEIVLDEQARPIDRFIHTLLVALVDVRLGRSTNVSGLARAFTDAGQDSQKLLANLSINLHMTTAELEQLGLSPQPVQVNE